MRGCFCLDAHPRMARIYWLSHPVTATEVVRMIDSGL